jgi:hypothetical protein
MLVLQDVVLARSCRRCIAIRQGWLPSSTCTTCSSLPKPKLAVPQRPASALVGGTEKQPSPSPAVPLASAAAACCVLLASAVAAPGPEPHHTLLLPLCLPGLQAPGWGSPMREGRCRSTCKDNTQPVDAWPHGLSWQAWGTTRAGCAYNSAVTAYAAAVPSPLPTYP